MFDFKYKLLFCLLIFLISIEVKTKDPYDNDLNGKKLICFTSSDSIDDWGIKFLQDKKVLLYSLDKFIYEIYQYSRTYRTDLRNIMILKGNDVEFVINRKTLKFGNKICKLNNNDPKILLENRIEELKKAKTKLNKI